MGCPTSPHHWVPPVIKWTKSDSGANSGVIGGSGRVAHSL